MGLNLNISNEGITYRYGESEPVIIIGYDFFENRGNIPIIDFEGNSTGICNIIIKTEQEYSEMSRDVIYTNGSDAVLLVTCLLMKHSMKRYKPYKVLEIGGYRGGLSYFLTKTAFTIHDKSEVVCLSEVPYEMELLEKFCTLGDEALANLSLLTSNTKVGILRDDYFDFVVINETELIQDPHATLINALRISRKGAKLLCITKRQQPLFRCFKDCFDDCEEYRLSETDSILVRTITKEDKVRSQRILQENSLETYENELADIHSRVGDILKELPDADEQQLKKAVSMISNMEDIAIKIFAEAEDIELKNIINSAKELLLDYMYTDRQNYREDCMKKLWTFARGLNEYKEEVYE